MNKKFHPGMVRDLKTDCAKCTEEVRSGFCNIGSGVSLKKTEMTSKSKELFFGVFFMFRLEKGGKTRTAFDRIYLYNGLECGKVENPNTFYPNCIVR